jgi:CheY-like chemotaxis protein
MHFAPSVTRPAPQPGGRATVLVVEDMEYFLEIAREALRGKYEVKTARTVDEASRALREGPVDVILLDIYLADGEDGLELLRRHPKPCPVLAFTAEDESEMYGEGWSRLQAVGIDGVVRKGMNVSEALQRKVAEALGEAEPPPQR